MNETKNVAAIRKWVRENRPDLQGHIANIIRGEIMGNTRAQGLLSLLTIGFAAGRCYQQDNPTDLERF